MSMFKRSRARRLKGREGEVLANGNVRYKILCDPSINPSGVFWAKVVLAGSSAADYQAAQAEMEAKRKELKALTSAAVVEAKKEPTKKKVTLADIFAAPRKIAPAAQGSGAPATEATKPEPVSNGTTAASAPAIIAPAPASTDAPTIAGKEAQVAVAIQEQSKGQESTAPIPAAAAPDGKQAGN